MSSSPSSSARAARVALASRLSDLRKDAGLTGRELALACGWHPSKVSRIQAAKVPVADADLRAWCAATGAGDQVADLIAASRAVESMYWEWRRQHQRGMRAAQEDGFTTLERSQRCRVYVSNVVPGFFQTAEYATALMRSITEFQGTPDDVAEAVEARVARSRFLYEGNHRFAVLVEEWVLRARIGSAETMAGQLGHLLAVMPLPSVSLGVIPMTVNRGLWPLEAFYLFDEKHVSVETLTAEVNVSRPSEVADYIRAFGELQKLAVYGVKARALITSAIDALG
ncbi:helix-turn-helix domain-containing protein [Streptacidiphilus cavernicola]|uniref:Helix-turn-helix domain-containing protein n=1 Tax=Streptacidiphilus cavernicola TaxID=3342716 RepID=A0ABV6VZX7_9ACTN